MNGCSSTIFPRSSDIFSTPSGVRIVFSASGAFARDFVRLFEPLPNRLPSIPTQDFRLFLPDMLLSYDHLRERALIYLYDFSNSDCPAADVVRARLEPLCAPTPLRSPTPVRGTPIAIGYRS